MQQAPTVIAPIYATPQPNASVQLYQGPVVLDQDGTRIDCEGEVRLEWLPSPRVIFSATESNADKTPSLADVDIYSENTPVTISIPGAMAPVPLAIVAVNRAWREDGGSVAVTGHCNDTIVTGGGVNLQHVVFHLVNFSETADGVIGEETPQETHEWLGRATAEFDGWKLTIDTLRSYKELKTALKAQGGFAITHAARLERVDSSAFSVAQAKQVLDALFWFFSLSRGFWSPPIFPVGFDGNQNVVWQEWQALRASSWRSADSWLTDRHHVSSSLQGALPGFWKTWNNPTWNDPSNSNTPLVFAIHWFISANTQAGATEGSIILAQTGLELMAWVRLVEDVKSRTSSQFNPIPASKKFEALLQHIGVSLAIPSGLSSLTTLAATKQWANGPEAIAGYRNTIVHPKSRKRNKDVVATESNEMLQLALWYLELALLHLFDYTGRYVNRVQASPRIAGQTEPVPWAPPAVAPPVATPPAVTPPNAP